MTFNDYALVEQRVDAQAARFETFLEQFLHAKTRLPSAPAMVLEIGAGKVVSSIRQYRDSLEAEGSGIIRINPSSSECEELELPHIASELAEKYFPLT